MAALPIIKVMSFNIRCGNANDGANHWEKRKFLTLARIQAFEPNLLGMQECRDDTQAEFVKSNLPGYRFYGVHRDLSGDTALEMAPILVEQSAFQVSQTGRFWLSETPEVVGSKSWGSFFARTVTWAKVLHIPTGRSLTFVNTHLDYHPPAIMGASEFLHPWLVQLQKESPVVITGDFNADKKSFAYHLLTGADGLSDAYRQVHTSGDDAGTFHNFGTLTTEPAIDWILVSNHFKTINAGVDRTHNANLFPSDHYPLWVELAWKG